MGGKEVSRRRELEEPCTWALVKIHYDESTRLVFYGRHTIQSRVGKEIFVSRHGRGNKSRKRAFLAIFYICFRSNHWRLPTYLSGWVGLKIGTRLVRN